MATIASVLNHTGISLVSAIDENAPAHSGHNAICMIGDHWRIAEGTVAFTSYGDGTKKIGTIANTGYMKNGMCWPHAGTRAFTALDARQATSDGAIKKVHVMSASEESRIGRIWSTRMAFSHRRMKMLLATPMAER